MRAWVLAGLVTAFLPMSLLRLIDGDEGYLLYAARLVSEGNLLYRDLFFQQMPLVPSVFGALFFLTGSGWIAARVLCALIAVAIGVFVYEIARLLTKSPPWAAFAVLLYAGCGFSLAWFPIVKTYGLATLCLVAACFLLLRYERWGPLLAGMLVLLSAGARLYFGAIGVLMIVYVLRRDGFTRRGLGALSGLAAGATLGALLLLTAILADPRAFWFDNITFVNMRMLDQTSFFGPLDFKAGVLGTIFPVLLTDGGGPLQFVGLFVLALGSLLSRKTRRNSLCGPIWICLGILNLLPHPPFSQYTCVLIPFLAVEAVIFLSTLEWKAIDRPLLGALALYLSLGAFDVHRFLVTGRNVPGVFAAQPPEAWRIETAERLAEAVDAKGADVGASSWPGYFVTAQTPLLVELANDFGIRAAERLPAELRERYHVASLADQVEIIRTHTAPVFVMGNWQLALEPELRAAGYERGERVANATVWHLR